eukprot:962220-Pelagomonas_calceolata.AAC.1
MSGASRPEITLPSRFRSDTVGHQYPQPRSARQSRTHHQHTSKVGVGCSLVSPPLPMPSVHCVDSGQGCKQKQPCRLNKIDNPAYLLAFRVEVCLAGITPIGVKVCRGVSQHMLAQPCSIVWMKYSIICRAWNCENIDKKCSSCQTSFATSGHHYMASKAATRPECRSEVENPGRVIGAPPISIIEARSRYIANGNSRPAPTKHRSGLARPKKRESGSFVLQASGSAFSSGSGTNALNHRSSELAVLMWIPDYCC